MSTNIAKRLTLMIDETRRVSALLQLPPAATACFVFAHGAGAGMEHPSMAAVAEELAARGIATLRFQFPYMERGSRRPDPPPLCHATVRAAVAEAARQAPKLPLFAVSLAAIIVQFGYTFLVMHAVQVLGAAEAIPFPLVILIIGVALLWFANRSRKLGWIAP